MGHENREKNLITSNPLILIGQNACTLQSAGNVLGCGIDSAPLTIADHFQGPRGAVSTGYTASDRLGTAAAFLHIKKCAITELRRCRVYPPVQMFLDIERLCDCSVEELQDCAPWKDVTWHTLCLISMCHGTFPALWRQRPRRNLSKSKPPEIVSICPRDTIWWAV